MPPDCPEGSLGRSGRAPGRSGSSSSFIPFSRYPLAPARRASNRSSSARDTVSITIAVVWQLRLDLGRGRDAVPRHPDVQQADVRLLATCSFHCGLSVRHIGADFEPAGFLQHPSDLGPRPDVVVCDEDPPFGHVGSLTSTHVPIPGRDLTSNVPPIDAQRSSMKVRPNPFGLGRPLASKPCPSSVTSRCDALTVLCQPDGDGRCVTMSGGVGDGFPDDPQKVLRDLSAQHDLLGKRPVEPSIPCLAARSSTVWLTET